MCECWGCVQTGPDQWPADRIRNLLSFCQLPPMPIASSQRSAEDWRRLVFARRLAMTGKIGEGEK